jgi:hypothetical protein
METPTKQEMIQCYFDDPKEKPYIKKINNALVKYYYFSEPTNVATGEKEVSNICILKGSSTLMRNEKEIALNQFDMIFLPNNDQITITPLISDKLANKICIVTTPNLGDISNTRSEKFEIQRFSLSKFVPRGELGDNQKMCTFREVWTAIKNGLYMSGFTNIPEVSLTQGVVTSVNLEKENDQIKIFSHIHPPYPEIYIYCIDDTTEAVAVTQFLINARGQSISRDLTDGEGIFFDGTLGHINFTKPTYKKIKYCLYMWIIPTFGRLQDVNPVTLRV